MRIHNSEHGCDSKRKHGWSSEVSRARKSLASVRVEGTLQALVEPEKLKSQDGWVVFQNIDGLTVSGGGTFDGQGSIA
ncbi:hypothetical protein L3X38_019431 [Prunus dulcis]|uniref:Uncharacterized protein n=1 Tax=Prunus dulcis TaxID=3755 RepID=A0AAD4WDM6_PRUDU|nr:hypothetical protein L3X38_019431 [Prunus dulcis]